MGLSGEAKLPWDISRWVDGSDVGIFFRAPRKEKPVSFAYGPTPRMGRGGIRRNAQTQATSPEIFVTAGVYVVNIQGDMSIAIGPIAYPRVLGMSRKNL